MKAPMRSVPRNARPSILYDRLANQIILLGVNNPCTDHIALLERRRTGEKHITVDFRRIPGRAADGFLVFGIDLIDQDVDLAVDLGGEDFSANFLLHPHEAMPALFL